MATATAVHPSTPISSILSVKEIDLSGSNHFGSGAVEATQSEVNMDEAIHLAALCKEGLNTLLEGQPAFNPSHPYTVEEILSLPLDIVRIDDALHDLPRRKSARLQLAAAIASLLYPAHTGSLSALIRYDADRVKLRAWATLQRKYDMFSRTLRNGHWIGPNGEVSFSTHSPMWSSRIVAQGPWNPEKFPISKDGTPALPMPVAVSEAADLAPFFHHLKHGGTDKIKDGSEGVDLDDGKGEPYYGTKGVEFKKGVVYEDNRMDLCKMVVGPDHIGSLMDSLRPNIFVRHFLLGNNIIGPVGAREIARFVEELPERIDTWYLAGNCIDGLSFKILVDALVKSPAVTNVWLKRNPLGRNAAEDVFRLITGAKNLRTLDLDQTELGDAGVAELFTRLAGYEGDTDRKLPLENIYLNGNGISVDGAKAIASFMASPHCGLTSIYLSCNPLGDAGTNALAAGLPKAPQLTRLALQSVGLSTDGSVALCEALTPHPRIRVLDIGQAFATNDLGQAYNYIEDGAGPALWTLVSVSTSLEFLNLGCCAITPHQLRCVSAAVAQSSSMLFYSAQSIFPDSAHMSQTFVPAQEHLANLFSSITSNKAQQNTDRMVKARLEANVRARYGEDVTYTAFLEGEKRWIVSDKTDVRKIDSVYRTRDMGLARRGLKVLVKDWDGDDDTLERVMNAQGPFCTKRRH